MKAEMERIAQRQPMEMLSMRRYELPQPSAAQKNDVSAWQEAVDNSMAQLEHQAGRCPPPPTRAYTHTHAHTRTHTHTHNCLHAFTLLPSPILQHRIVNLELLGQYGSNAWRFHNDALQCMVTSEQKTLDALRAHTQEVNRCRKTEQTKAGEKLSQLEAQ